MKILNVYRSEPDETVKKVVEIVTRARESYLLVVITCPPVLPGDFFFLSDNA